MLDGTGATGHTNNHGPARVNGRRRLWLLAIWSVVVLLLLLAAVVAWNLTRPPERIDTGDALLDAYGQMLVDSGLTAYPRGSKRLKQTAPLRAQRMSEIEQRFNTDPRYYMLRYSMGSPGNYYDSAVAGLKLPEQVRFLESAREKKVVEWRILLQLARCYEMAWHQEAKEGILPAQIKHQAPLETEQSYLHALRNYIDERHKAQADALHAELWRAGADQAQVHYFLYTIACERGQYELAARYLRSGNTAPRLDCDACYPMDVMRKAAAEGRLVGGSEALSGFLAQQEINTPAFNGDSIKLTANYFANAAVARKDKQGLSDMYQSACRRACAPEETLLNRLITVNCGGKARKAMGWLQPQPSPRTAKARADAKAIAKKYKGLVKQSRTGSDSLLAEYGEIKWLSGMFPSIAVRKSLHMCWVLLCEDYQLGAGGFMLLTEELAALPLLD